MNMLSAFVRVFSWARLFRGLFVSTRKHRARSARGARGSNPSQKTPRQRSARSALSTRVARSLLILKSAFRRNAQAALRFYEGKKLWFTSSTWGGWCFATLLLAGVVGIAVAYLSLIPKDADTLKYLEFYAVVVIGLMSLYIAGTSFWEKRGSAFSVEYQTEKDSNAAQFIKSAATEEEIIGNHANSTMPYVKRLYIRNEKNKHEAIKRILLQLPNNQILLLKEYKKANALLIKPYEDEVIEFNAATVYFKNFTDLSDNRGFSVKYENYFYILKNVDMLDRGSIIIETTRGQSYVRGCGKNTLSYTKENLLTPFTILFHESVGNQKLVFDIKIIRSSEIVFKENFINDEDFYENLKKHIISHPDTNLKFEAREKDLSIQIVLNTDKKAFLSYFFQANKQKYAFSVQRELQEDFNKAYNKYNFSESETDSKKHDVTDFCVEFMIFCNIWASKKWNKDGSRIYKYLTGSNNKLAIKNLEIKIIDDL